MKDGRDGLTSHLATSPCHLNVQFFCISLLLQKQVWTWGMYVCVRKRDRSESSPDAPEGICWVPIEGDYRQMELSGKLELLKDFVKLGQWAGSFPSKALSFLFSSCIWLCEGYSPPAHSSFWNQNQKVIKIWKFMWETFIIILKSATRFWEWWCEHWFLFFLFRAGFRDVFWANVFSKQLGEEPTSGPFVARSYSMARPYFCFRDYSLLIWWVTVPKSAVDMGS